MFVELFLQKTVIHSHKFFTWKDISSPTSISVQNLPQNDENIQILVIDFSDFRIFFWSPLRPNAHVLSWITADLLYRGDIQFWILTGSHVLWLITQILQKFTELLSHKDMYLLMLSGMEVSWSKLFKVSIFFLCFEKFAPKFEFRVLWKHLVNVVFL